MRAQVRWSIAVLGTGFLAVMLLAQWSGARTQNHMQVASTSLLPATLASQEAVSSFQRCVSTYSEAVIMDDKNSLVRAGEAAQAVQAALQAVHKSLASTPEKQNQVGSLISDFDELASRSKTTYAQMIESKGNFTPELQAAAAHLAEQNRHMEESLRQLRTTLSESLQGRMDTVYSSSTTERIFGLALFLVLALGGTAFTVMVERRVSRPLQQLITRCKEIAGDLTGADQEITTGDEITELAHSFDSLTSHLKAMAAISDRIAGGDLAQEVHARSEHDALGHALARMTEGLGGLVRGVRGSATEVAACAGDVARASEESARISSQSSNAIDEVTSTMHEITINVQNVVKHTQVQSAKVSETSASIHQMVTSIQRVADSSGALLQLSDRSRAEVQGGIERMQKATDGLNHINRSIQTSSAIIDALGRRAESIGKIVDVIDDMAEQTNLLALNAAIEAARAGEHGLGFAVVADEVRKLAEKSAQSTKEISELILSIQKEAQNAVQNMNQSAGIVNEGLALGAELESALKQIAKVVTEVHQFAREIGGATAEQSKGSTQIAQATERLNGITHEINCSVEEQAAGTQAIVKAMENMRSLVQRSTSGNTQVAASADQMSKMSRILLDLIDRFKLEWRSDPDEDSKRAPRRAMGPGTTNDRPAYAREGQPAFHAPQLAKNRAH